MLILITLCANFKLTGHKNATGKIIESDIMVDEGEIDAKREFMAKRQQTDLPVIFEWHKLLWRSRVIPYTYSGYFSG